MSKIRFIHAADIHLGSYLYLAGDSLPQYLEQCSKDATLEAFRRVCDAVLKEDADFLIIAGDLYDREAGSVRAQEFFVSQAKILAEAGKDIFVIAGNHDPLRDVPNLFELPANVKIFPGDNPLIHKVLDDQGQPLAQLIGQSYRFKAETQKIHKQYSELPAGLWNIALLHTQLAGEVSNYVPCNLGELKSRKDIHYWALGHIHQKGILNDEYPYIVYPGIPQGRHFGEQGRGGCYLVELSQAQGGQLTFLPTAPIVYKRVEVLIDEEKNERLESLEDLADIIWETGEKIFPKETAEGEYPLAGYVVEWLVKGRSHLAGALAENEEETLGVLVDILRQRSKESRSFVWTNDINLNLGKSLDYDGLLKNSIVRQELLRLVSIYEEEAPIKVNEQILKDLGDIWQGSEPSEEYVPREDLRFHLDGDTLAELLSTAKARILEKLAGEADGH